MRIDDLINRLIELKKEYNVTEVAILNENNGIEHVVCNYDKDRNIIIIY